MFSGAPFGSALPRVFGGQVIGQALAAAGRTVPAVRRPHSLHAYFLRAGILEQTDRLRGDHGPRRSIVLDARSASSSGNRADLHDDGFLPRRRTRPRAPNLAALGPSTPCPPDVRRSIQRTGRTSTRSGHRSTSVTCRRQHPAPHRSSGTQTWMRITEPLPDDPFLHACVLACISDLSLLTVTLAPHGIPPRHEGYQVASLDHSCGFTGSAGSTTGCSTTRAHPACRRPWGSLRDGSSPPTEPSWPPSLRRAWFAFSAGRTAEPHRAARPRR